MRPTTLPSFPRTRHVAALAVSESTHKSTEEDSLMVLTIVISEPEGKSLIQSKKNVKPASPVINFAPGRPIGAAEESGILTFMLRVGGGCTRSNMLRASVRNLGARWWPTVHRVSTAGADKHSSSTMAALAAGDLRSFGYTSGSRRADLIR